ncbi:MAG: hypothetical protein COW55_15245 [Rhodobacteraceae bacterium CG17_big_fil_post_rev_8_21_14_2_50_65_11]|nr:MAG: hypothetical protein COW55_15245 [Rhodobacteraceae bacterium CG17_big_fil_post_rev_8_21_14_2_50_65_11]
MKRACGLLVAATIAPALAGAEGFSSGYVNGFVSDVECMDTARRAMNAQYARYGVQPDTGEASFSVYGWDVPPGVTQVALVCTEDQGRYSATITGYSLEEDGTRLETVEMFMDMLEGTAPIAGSK